MKQKNTLYGLFLLAPATVFSTPLNSVTAKPVSTGNLLNWSVGLVIVLSIFFLLIWLLKKINTGFVAGSGQLRVIGGLSLGMREKIVVLRAGRKQLILGVSPGKIETLHVLEGDDCLSDDQGKKVRRQDNSFANKLFQVQSKNND
jgi:flagellar protein FliO/FliZ